jgi:uncharacterized coiled-coil DUF342 family protein
MSDQEIAAVGTFTKQRDELIIEVADLTNKKENLITETQTIFDNANTAKKETDMAKQKQEEIQVATATLEAVEEEKRNSVKKEIEVLINDRDSKILDLKLITEALDKSASVIGHLAESVSSVKDYANEAKQEIASVVGEFSEIKSGIISSIEDIKQNLKSINNEIIEKKFEVERKTQKLEDYEVTLRKKENELNDFYNRFMEEYEAKKKELNIK